MLCVCARVRVTQLRQLLAVTGCVTPMRSSLGTFKARKEERKHGENQKNTKSVGTDKLNDFDYFAK